MTAAKPGPIPVTVIGGYLGSGKTTLLNQLLSQTVGQRIAVLVNDFGDIGIDGDLIAAADGDTITLTNGCVCCRIGSDLMTALWSVRDRQDPPEHLIIEASGIADPAPIAHHGGRQGFPRPQAQRALPRQRQRRGGGVHRRCGGGVAH